MHTRAIAAPVRILRDFSLDKSLVGGEVVHLTHVRIFRIPNLRIFHYCPWMKAKITFTTL